MDYQDYQGAENVYLIQTQTPEGGIVHEVYLVPSPALVLNPVIEAFPLSHVIYYDEEYICSKFNPGSYDLCEQEAHATLEAAVAEGTNFAKKILQQYVSSRTAPPRRQMLDAGSTCRIN